MDLYEKILINYLYKSTLASLFQREERSKQVIEKLKYIHGKLMQLSDMQVGHTGRILKIHAGDALYRHRLISMGLLPGTEFTVTRMAPLGDPIEITVRGFALSLRKGEARILQIERVVV